MKFFSLCVSCLAVTVSSLSLGRTPASPDDISTITGTSPRPVGAHLPSDAHHHGVTTTRSDFARQATLIVAGAVAAAASAPETGGVAVGGGLMLLVAAPEPASARGRATLEQAYDRYTPRILAGGSFYKDQLKALIARDDFAGIKAALAEPPNKTKEDRAKADGGVADRAAQAGQFSDARVAVAMDLFAAQFSDNSISPKTKAMRQDVDEIRSVIRGMVSVSRQALGEDSAGGGGFFGIGKKQPSKGELSAELKKLYIQGGTSWNRYVFAANEGLPVTLNKLPYL
jgi:hypothetical protein